MEIPDSVFKLLDYGMTGFIAIVLVFRINSKLDKILAKLEVKEDESNSK